MLKISKIKDYYKYIFYSSITIILIILVILLLSNNKNNIADKEIFITNPENVISPVKQEQTGYENAEYQTYFSDLTYEPITNIESSIYNWQKIFDLFASNRVNIWLKSDVSKTHLENLSSKIHKVDKEFFKGNSDDILSTYGKVIKEEAKYYKLDWRLIISIIKQESDFTSTALSRAGAYGFMQIMPRTGQTLEQTLNLEDHTSPTNNLIAGIYYYALLVARYDVAGEPDKFMLALAAYNCGSGHVEDAMSITYYEGKDYLKWNNVSQALKKLGPDNDTLHVKIWKSKPPNGVFTNWIEPVNYVFNIMYYWDQYKKYYPIPEDKPKSFKRKKQNK